MPISAQKITPCLWFDTQAEEAALFYISIFENSRIRAISRYGKAGYQQHGKPPGSVLTVEFELEGQTFVALNGGANFKFNEAISLQIRCETQEDIDLFWNRLTAGGEAGPCGWLKDKYGLSWQVVPTMLPEMLMDQDSEKSERVMTALLQMKKFDVAALQRAYAGSA